MKIFSFLVSPLLGLLVSFRSLNTKTSIIVVFLFCAVFGLAFSVPYQVTDEYMDGISYRATFEMLRDTPSVTYSDTVASYGDPIGGIKDLYFFTIAYFVSRITDNYHVMFLVFAIVFAFFQLRSLQFFTRLKGYGPSFFCVLLVCLFLNNQIYNINGVRFWTAAWMAVYAILQIFINKRRFYFLLLAVTPVVHISYLFLIAVVLIALLLRHLNGMWVFLFIISFFISTTSLALMLDAVDVLPPMLAHLVEAYLDEDFIAVRQGAEGSGFFWVQRLFETILSLYINILIALLILNRKAILNSDDKDIYQFFLVLVTIANFVMAIPSLGSRFIEVSYPFIALLWLNHYKELKYRRVVYFLPFAFFMKWFYLLRDCLSVLNGDFLLSPIYIFIKYLFI